MFVKNRFALATLLFVFSTLPAIAEVLTFETWRGHQVIRLSGSIEVGTADRFASVIESSTVLPHGVPVLLLDSSGGLVNEAMKMSAIMDEIPFHTVVPDGAHCASACASILFIAGIYRTVEGSGLLGQHSCSINGVPDQTCNDRLSENAFQHGVSYGSIQAFVSYVAPEDILWFNREDAEGWGLTRYPGEVESGFKKIDPYLMQFLTGSAPTAQPVWRIDFREDGFQAFSRTVSDFEREMQINLFCVENLRGRLFLSMEIYGPIQAISDAVLGLRITIDRYSWEDRKPIIWQVDQEITEVITEVPREQIIDILSKNDQLEFYIALEEPYQPIVGSTHLRSSGVNLRFAANHCASGDYVGTRAPLD